MKRLFIGFISLLFCMIALAEEAVIQLHTSNEDRGIDKRSLFIEPTVTYDGDMIYIYSPIPIEYIQVTIKDDLNNIVRSDMTAISFSQGYALELGDLPKGQYTMELCVGEKVFYGYFYITL